MHEPKTHGAAHAYSALGATSTSSVRHAAARPRRSREVDEPTFGDETEGGQRTPSQLLSDIIIIIAGGACMAEMVGEGQR